MKFYNAHALMPIESKTVTKIKKIVFDIETIYWIEPYSIGLYDNARMITFDGKNCIEEFLNAFLVHRYRGFTAYAHNGGKFDFSFILKELVQKKYCEKYQIKPMRAGARIIQIEISSFADKMRNGKIKKEIVQTWTLRDSYAMLPFALKKLTTNFDVANKKGDFDHKKINWNNWKQLMPEWKPYLNNDCIGLYQVLDKWEDYLIKKYNTSLKKSITLAQLSMQIFRRQFLKKPIATYQAQEDDIRLSYYGGRTEIFRMYGENLNYYDVNSLYPFVMEEKEMPVGTPIKSFIMKPSDFGVAFAEVECPLDLKYPLLPYRSLKGKLTFPTGKWSGWYCTPELKKAEELGYKIKIKYGYKFQKAKLFTDYINTLYKVKQNAKSGTVDYIASKLLMNSLYGKFGQRRERESLTIFPKSTIDLTPVDFFGDLPVFIEKSESKAKHILPAIASFVTCYARLELYKLIEKSIKKGGKVYYCDTDSLITDIKLPCSNKLGDIKDELIEEGGIKEGVFLLPKMYGIKTGKGELIKCKGFPKNLFKFNVFKNALLNGDYSKFKFSTQKIATPFESMRRNKTFVSMIKFSRRVMSRYDKRKVIENFDTVPIEVLG